jgi:hypothetical protein
MGSIDIKESVRRAVAMEWPRFATNHPRLAQVLDETLVTESAIESIADDPEYQEAIATADALGTGAEAIAATVQRLVGQWLRQLL